MMKTDTEVLNNWLAKDYVFVLDRGFRNSLSLIRDLGYQVHNLAYLSQSEKQHTTSDANDSRSVRKVRWVVESASGRLKRCQFLANIVPTFMLKYIVDFVRIVAGICNKYINILQKVKESNLVQEIVKPRCLDKKRSVWHNMQAPHVWKECPRLAEII